MIHCCVGIMAYNEETNIGNLLEALCSQQTRQVQIDEIIVVASGCTDRTEEIVASYLPRDGRIQLLRQARREGKASAINLLLRTTHCEVIVLQSADTLPRSNSIEALVSRLDDPVVGMVGGRPVPTNRTATLMGYAAYLLWELHHQISLQTPKLGELIAFRNVIRQIPSQTAADEASIEGLIQAQGYRLAYVPEAVVYNRGPESIKEFLLQRRRIFAGHLYVQATTGYQVSTLNGFRIAILFLKNFRQQLTPWSWRRFLWGPVISALEVWARLLAMYDYTFQRRIPYNWTVAKSTKSRVEIPETLDATMPEL